MNAVEIEEAVSDLVEQPFEPQEFPFAFLAAFGNKATTIKRLRSTGKGSTNKSDIPGGVLQRNNIHLAVSEPGQVGDTLKALLASPTTESQKAKYALATDGQTIEAENLVEGETLACDYADLPNHFGFFLPLAGITTVKQIRDNAFDIKATSRLNRLYVELLKHNPDWDTAERREDLNHFFARLIFCFYAEDTGIFRGGKGGEAEAQGLFTATIDQMTERDASNTHEVLAEIFRAMDTKADDRESGQFRGWANQFPYVNGGLFEGCITGADVPTFTKIARSYLLHIGGLDWTKINPDIFGSMIQAVADDEERGALGMHYTSVPNILKVLNPLFLDELRAKLDEAGDGSDQGSRRKLLNLRNRMARIRVFDPACGSGNFLVIAYKQMREIEAEINKRRNEADRRTDIPLTNFRGIELRHFACEIARLALVIAEFQCDASYRGETLARAEFLPLDQRNWITHGNALRIDWLTVCPAAGEHKKLHTETLEEAARKHDEIAFQNEGGETYICGNPPYKGTKNQSKEEKTELKAIFKEYTTRSGTLDYVAGWFLKASQFTQSSPASFAFVSTNSICQGGQVPVLWPILFAAGLEIQFAYQSFKWTNLAAKNAGVIVVVVGLSNPNKLPKRLFQKTDKESSVESTVSRIGPYLIPGQDTVVYSRTQPLNGLPEVSLGNAPYDGGHLILHRAEIPKLGLSHQDHRRWIRPLLGSAEIIGGVTRFCIWIEDDSLNDAIQYIELKQRIQQVKAMRLSSRDAGTQAMASRPHQFREMRSASHYTVAIPLVSSENREYLTPDVIGQPCSMTNKSYAIYDPPLWAVSLLASRIHLLWIGSVCGRMKTDHSYSNKMGWNTFPAPLLTDQNKTDLMRCAENILLARESYWPATIAEMYDPDRMDVEFPEVRAAHERNDETLERIYIGRRFRNDTERLEKLFEMYTQMTEGASSAKEAASA